MPVMPIEKVIYTATAHTTGGRDGGASRSRMQIKLPADLVIDAEVDLGTNAGSYLIQARFDVQLPGIDRETVQSWSMARTRSVRTPRPLTATSTS
jgi:hypothetical protein